jgi:hypothetical protein
MISPVDDAPDREPPHPGESPEPDENPDAAPDDDADPDGEGVPFGFDVLPAALDRQVSCPHGFDLQYCPFGCA